MMKKIVGFSLLELMIVISIVGILTAIAIPNYSQYIVREKRFEAQAMLLRLSSALENFYTQNNTYVGASLEKLDIPATCANNQYQLAITSVTGNNFLIIANPLGQQTKRDRLCGALTLNASNQEGITGAGDIRSCWGS